MLTSRRIFLAGLGAATVLKSTGASRAAGPRPKLILIILRGGMDGLTAIAPITDPHINTLRPHLVPKNAIALGGGFAAHPALKTWAGWAKGGQAGFIHAIAGPYRDRSHFKAQDLLETGADAVPGRDGWLARALERRPGLSALSIGPAQPLILKGAQNASSWSPAVVAPASDDTLMRLASLYADDKLLRAALEKAVETNAVAGEMGGAMRQGGFGAAGAIKAQMAGAGRLLKAQDGPDIAVIDIDGWDTHGGQINRLGRMLTALDDGLATLKSELGIMWQSSAITIVSEFGRTVRDNGGGGTDHGTGGLALLAGGQIKPGQHGDWPGLSSRALYDNRDLAPANDMYALFSGLLTDLYGFDSADLRAVFGPLTPRPISIAV